MVLRGKRLVNLWIKTRCKIPSVYDVTRIKQNITCIPTLLCTLLKHLWQQLLHMMQQALYARMHTYFGVEPLKLHVAGWGTAVHSHFQISQEMFNQVQSGSGSDRTFTEWS